MVFFPFPNSCMMFLDSAVALVEEWKSIFLLSYFISCHADCSMEYIGYA